MGIPLLAGREFRESDSMSGNRVAVVNETLVKQYFEGRNPIGLHLVSGRNKPVNTEIVGIVKDSKYDDLRESPVPFAYFSAQQDTNPGPMTFYIRTTLPTEALSLPLRQMMRRVDPNVPIEGPRSMRDTILDSVYADRIIAALSCVFAALATILAAVGLYGVIAWAVTRRRREIGIRIAMGARSGDILRMILLEVLWLGTAGMVIAAPLWFAVSRMLESQLYGVSSRDPLTLAGSVVVLTVVAAAAGLVPAIRGSRIQPMLAIRE